MELTIENLSERISDIIEESACLNEQWNNSLKKTIHLAIFIEPYLDLIFKGKKTIESRFSINKILPYHKIQIGDVILLKKSSGKIEGATARQWPSVSTLDIY